MATAGASSRWALNLGGRIADGPDAEEESKKAATAARRAVLCSTGSAGLPYSPPDPYGEDPGDVPKRFVPGFTRPPSKDEIVEAALLSLNGCPKTAASFSLEPAGAAGSINTRSMRPGKLDEKRARELFEEGAKQGSATAVAWLSYMQVCLFRLSLRLFRLFRLSSASAVASLNSLSACCLNYCLAAYAN